MLKSAGAEQERRDEKDSCVSSCALCTVRAVRESGSFFDWLDRLEDSTEPPTTGPLRLGEVVVEDLAGGSIKKGAEGIELILRNIPAYAPFRPLRVPLVRRYVEQQVSGCESKACEIASKPQPAVDQAQHAR
jgi:hypothetical protein